jgi:hypothetical protein
MSNKSQLYFIDSTVAAAKVLDYFTANDAVYPAAVTDANSTGRNNHPLVAYPKAELTFVDFHGVLPESGLIKVSLIWAATIAAGSVLWEVAWERDNSTVLLPQVDLDVDSFAPAKGVVSAAPLAPGLLREAALVFTPPEIGSILPGEPYRLRVTRNGLLGSDTLDGDAQLFRVILGAP